MIELITDLPDDVLGIEARGGVTGEEYEQVLIRAALSLPQLAER